MALPLRILRFVPLRPGSWVVAAALMGLAAPGFTGPARAGLLRPVLQLIRPQLEHRLARICVEAASGGDPALERSLQDPCRKLAVPTSKCLIEETDNTGRGLGAIEGVASGQMAVQMIFVRVGNTELRTTKW